MTREEVRRVRGIMHQLELPLLTLEESEKYSIEYELEAEIASPPPFSTIAPPAKEVEEPEYTGPRKHHYRRWRQKLGLVRL